MPFDEAGVFRAAVVDEADLADARGVQLLDVGEAGFRLA